MPRRSDKRDAAREAYLSRRRDGEEVNLQRLAEELGVKYDTLRRWKSADKWDEAQPPPKRTRLAAQEQKRCGQHRRRTAPKPECTDAWRLFRGLL